MSKAGKWLLIFGIIALVSAIIFGCTVAIFGVKDNNYGVVVDGHDILSGNWTLGGTNMGRSGIIFRHDDSNVSYDFEKGKTYTADFDAEGLSDIKIGLASCKAAVSCTDTGRINIAYTSGNAPVEFKAELKDGVLDISEKIRLSIFALGSIKNAELNVELPRALYNSLDIDLASGGVTARELKLGDLKANLASGSLDLELFAERLDLNVASGNASVKNITDESADNIVINVASGTVELNGFGSDRTKAALASGKVTLSGISGSVKGEIMSGTLTLGYSEWNDDLSIELASGRADVTLPSGSGAEIDCEQLSGKTEVSLDSDSMTLGKNSHVTVGGANIHKIDVDGASGSVKIHN